jgi:outer membrane protein assembly factor BamB
MPLEGRTLQDAANLRIMEEHTIENYAQKKETTMIRKPDGIAASVPQAEKKAHPHEKGDVEQTSLAPEDTMVMCSLTGSGTAKPMVSIDRASKVLDGTESANEIAADLTIQWKHDTGCGFGTEPVVAPDGTVFAGCYDGKLFAIKDNAVLWRFGGVGSGISAPHIGKDGVLYAGGGSFHGKLLALKDGQKLWEYETGNTINPSPCQGPDGTVYVGNNDGKIFAVKEGKLKWEKKLGDYIASPPVMSDDGTLHIIGSDGVLHAFKNKRQSWELKVGNIVSTKPAIAPDGTVYVGSDDGSLYAIKKGKVKWKFPAGPSCSTPTLGPDGTVYVGGFDRLIALKDGKKLWDYQAGGAITMSPPCLGPDGTLYVTNTFYGEIKRDREQNSISQGHFTTITAVKDGKKMWDYTADSFIYHGLAAGSDGTIYGTSEHGTLYAFYGTPRDDIAEELRDPSKMVEHVDDFVIIGGVKLPIMKHINVGDLMKSMQKEAS